MDPGNFLKETQRIATGQGFRVQRAIRTSDFLNSVGSAITTITTPAASAVGMAWGDAQTSQVWFHVTGDYDESNDELKLILFGDDLDGTDAISISAINRYREGGLAAGVAATVFTPTTGQVFAVATTKVTWDLTGNGFKCGDQVRVSLLSAGGGTTLKTHGGFWQYKSDLALFDAALR